MWTASGSISLELLGDHQLRRQRQRLGGEGRVLLRVREHPAEGLRQIFGKLHRAAGAMVRHALQQQIHRIAAARLPSG